MIKLVIFDLDGTLIDSLTDIAEAANSTLSNCSFPTHPRDSYRYFVGNGLHNLIQRIVPPGTSETIRNNLAEDFKKEYHQGWNVRTSPYPGIHFMLQELALKKVDTAVLSNKPHDFTIRCAREFFPETTFTRVYGQDSHTQLKPDPSGALKIAEECNRQVCDCLFVGDTAIDIETGKKAGMTSVGVTWGFREQSELERAGADIIINSPEELISYV